MRILEVTVVQLLADTSHYLKDIRRYKKEANIYQKKINSYQLDSLTFESAISKKDTAIRLLHEDNLLKDVQISNRNKVLKIAIPAAFFLGGIVGIKISN